MRACFNLWSIVAVSLALLAGPLPAEFAYVVAGVVVFAYRVSDNGALTPVSGSPFSTGGASSVAVDLFGRFLYVANTGSNINSLKPGSASAYRIAENGALTPVAGSPFLAGSSAPISVAVDLFGRFVYVGNGLTSNISAFRIGANGALTSVAGSPFPTGILPRSVAFSP